MSLVEILQNVKTIRARLRNPPNAIFDPGINLRNGRPVNQRPPRRFVPSEPVAPVVEEPTVEAPAENSIEERLKRVEEYLGFDKPEKPAFPRIQIRTIQRVVCAFYDTSLEDMISKRRDKPLVRIRHIAMYLAKTMTMKSFPDIGRKFGGRDHTTVLHAVNKIEATREFDAELSAELDALHPMLLAALEAEDS